MAEDLRTVPETDVNVKANYVLKEVDDLLKSMGKKLSEYDLPKLSKECRSNAMLVKEILEEHSIMTPVEDVEAISQLNIDQNHAFKIIMQRIRDGKHGTFFIDRPGGTGKTFLYRALLAKIRASNNITIATATSGIAAAIIPGGRTAHSRFKIPIDINMNDACKITKQSSMAKLLTKAALIIWDEALMSKKYAIEALDRTLQDMMESSLPFGSKVIIVGGNFRQVLPVVPRATQEETIDASNGTEEIISGNLVQIP
ncbi:uncharacterized protein LOC143852470 [Tasmannia lanceolata]|uniref:uncharacterized protein LOC143852470 n=1 Tax=Tasmannia lanceolata TaxID=3420 RepID=UPI004064461B